MKLGDAVKKATDAVGIPQCAACKKRQEALNAAGDAVVDPMKRARDAMREKIADLIARRPKR